MNTKVNKRVLIGWTISILLPILIFFTPTTTYFTEDLRLFAVITIFMISIIAFELLPVVVSAIMLPSFYVMFSLVPPEIAYKAWTGSTIWMVLGGLVLSTVLDECGLLKRIAYYIIRKCGGTYNGAVFGCFITGIILNIITFCHGWIVNSALVFGVCKAMNLKASRESSLVCFAGIAAATGTTICLYDPGYIAILEGSLQQFIVGYKMAPYIPFIYNGLFIVWCLITILIFMKVYKTKDMNVTFRKEFFDEEYEKLGKMSMKEKKSLAIVLLLLIYLFTTNFTGLPASYGFMSIPYLLFVPGIAVGNTKTTEKINFSMILFVAACIGVGAVGTAVGFGDFLESVAVPLLKGQSVLVTCIAFMILGMVANLFLTPYAMLGGLSATFAQIAVSLDMNPVVACMILLFTCDMVFLPYQSTGNLIMYSYGLMPIKDFFKQEGLKSLIMFAGFIIVMFPLWYLLGLM